MGIIFLLVLASQLGNISARTLRLKPELVPDVNQAVDVKTLIEDAVGCESTSNPCYQGQCNAETNRCECDAGWTGEKCDTNIDECASSPCGKNGICVDGIGGYTCQCFSGWIGSQCSVASDQYGFVAGGLDTIPFPTPCQNNDYDTGFFCPEENNTDCHPRSELCDGIEVNCMNSADEGSICEFIPPAQNTANSGGFVGAVNGSNSISLVEPAAPPEKKCPSQPCANGKCYEWPSYENGYLCACDKGYKGNNCEVQMIEDAVGCESTSNPCYQGQCNAETNRCECDAGWTGEICDTNIDECASSPCGVNGICVDGIGGYTCQCFSGWIGSQCSVEEHDACSSSPCRNGGTCGNGFSSDEYICLCEEGWTGKNCNTDIDDCVNSPCVNGVCQDGVNKYFCSCTQGWTGTNCDFDANECSSNPCGNNGFCEDGNNEYSCLCDNGWTGSNCETNVNECSSNPCGNNGFCEDGNNEYNCLCDNGWTGSNCQTNINECSSSPCGNNGFCEDGNNEYSCLCDNGWTGSNCETSLADEGPGPDMGGDTTNPCTDRPCGPDMRCIYAPDIDQPYCLPKILPCLCKNNGVCEDNPEYDSRRCVCPENYRGIACEEGPINQ